MSDRVDAERSGSGAGSTRTSRRRRLYEIFILGGLLAALIGLAATLIPLLAPDDASTPSAAPAPPSTSVVAPPPAPTTVAAQPTPVETVGQGPEQSSVESGSVAWSGRIVLEQTSSDNLTDLDSTPPTRVHDDAVGDVYVPCCMTEDAADVADYDGSGLLALWTGSGIPEFDQCRESALSQGQETVSGVGTGSVLCVKTSEGRIARLTVHGVVKFKSVSADAVVWHG